MNLLDSGARQVFQTGAVRDITEGKGRCDLLPLDVVGSLLSDYEYWRITRKETFSYMPTVLELVGKYVDTMETFHLSSAVCRFVDDAFKGDIYGAIIELSKHYEDGAKKYSPNNWKLGINQHCFVDSAIRHYLKYLRSDTDEPHNRAVLWNLIGAIWTHRNHPELNDINEQGARSKVDCLQTLYERYKLQWMLDHGYSLTDMVSAVSRHTDTIAGIDFEEAYKLWELEAGFDSELWVSYDEWLNCDHLEEV